MNKTPLHIFVGYDSRQDLAYEVCRYSMEKHSSRKLMIQPIKKTEMIERGLYHRKGDPLASTEFTYTRFLVPKLMNFQGWALFVDSDFLFNVDIGELFSSCDDRYAVMCVKHDHRPSETTKMDGCVQTIYPRKNWSSLILWNCSHAANRVVTPEVVSSESGAFLHRFQWLEDELIGSLPETWNWLEGWSAKPDHGLPKAIHYTRGGPWFKEWKNVEYASEWNEVLESMNMQCNR